MKWIEVEFLGRVIRVPAVKAGGRLWLHLAGQTHEVDLSAGARRTGGDREKTHPGVVLAPMPGKITRVNVRVGDNVRKGQALIVMEAMKMEYTLEADRDGQAREVNVTAGEQVGLGQVLARLGDPA